ncbi:MAG: DUF2064 domain-containing protein [Psychroflexus sp.]|nr:DUF2064 domain-containing protein [Psychroflexus sp.]MDN6309095.1 DUF2064 domain-containing protein [Psychroflexus sp.]
MLPSTAILFFYQNPEVEKKNLGQGRIQFFRRQNQRIKQQLASSGLHCFCYDESKQVGETFAERYLNAIEAIFEAKYDSVISIGNDSPHLDLNHLYETVDRLKTHDMCFGPSHDGGFYLWGLHRSSFVKEQFLQLPWQSSSLLDEFTNLLKDQSENYTFLETLSDIDLKSDVPLVLSEQADLKGDIIRLLSAMIAVAQHPSIDQFLPRSKVYQATFYNKGSPL